MKNRLLGLAVILAVIWLLFSGMWTHPVMIPLGVVSVALCVWLSARLAIVDREGLPLHVLGRGLRYWPWLLARIVLSNLHVARRIVQPRLAINPRIIRLDTSQHSDLGRTILANSITLTPGTVSIHVRERELWFYALDDESARYALSGEMDRHARDFEGGAT